MTKRKAILLLCCMLLALPFSRAMADQASAIEAVRAQPGVLDAVVDNTGNLYVTVKPQDAQWKQYAQAVCRLVNPHQGRIFQVRIVEVTAVMPAQAPARWSRLGEARCDGSR